MEGVGIVGQNGTEREKTPLSGGAWECVTQALIGATQLLRGTRYVECVCVCIWKCILAVL